VDVSKCPPNGCQSEKNIVLKQLHFVKWILFPKVVMDHTVSPRGLHAACGPYVVQACSWVLAIIIWLSFNFCSRLKKTVLMRFYYRRLVSIWTRL
jgi:hypothetical protein